MVREIIHVQPNRMPFLSAQSSYYEENCSIPFSESCLHAVLAEISMHGILTEISIVKGTS